MTRSDNHFENVLIKNCISGDIKSQKTLYYLYAEPMFRICSRYAKNEMDAEDLMQEGFIKVFKNLKNFRHEGSFEGWMKRIFVNNALLFVGRQMKISELTGFEDSVIEKSSSGLENLYEKDLMTVIGRLSNRSRTVFQLYAVHGFTHKEISRTLGITEGTSKGQFSRAKAKLRDLIENGPKSSVLEIAV